MSGELHIILNCIVEFLGTTQRSRGTSVPPSLTRGRFGAAGTVRRARGGGPDADRYQVRDEGKGQDLNSRVAVEGARRTRDDRN